MPFLLVRHAQDGVAEITILAEDVGVGVMLVVMEVAPHAGIADVVPLVALRIQLRIIGPVVLAMHHVVADLHVLDDLGVRECGDTDDERDRIEAKANHRATGDRAAARRSAEHTSELQSLMRISYAAFGLKKK